jgi:hypothetical protein
LIVLIGLWFLLPVLFAILTHATFYDNFRHFLFVIPPLFILAAIGMQGVLDWLKKTPLRALALLIIIAPNIYWDVKMHPYEYIYYNSLVGGVGGAFRRFDMDYWAVSYREATNTINKIAPKGAQVIVYGPYLVVEDYARPDLIIRGFSNSATYKFNVPTYVILLTRHDKDQYLFPEATTIYTIGREGAIFSIIKQFPVTSNSP